MATPPQQPPPYPPPQHGMDPRDYARAQKEYYKAWKDQQRDAWKSSRDQWKAQRSAYHDQRSAWYSRRRSIVGPVILITIGVVFLLVQTGHMEGWRTWQWFGRWWPAILIAAGIARLIEWMMDRDQPYPSRGSGYVGLLVLIVIVGLAATAANHIGMNDWNGWNHLGDDDNDFSFMHGPEHDYDGQFWAAVPAGNSVQIISSVHGDITVTAAGPNSTPPPPSGGMMEHAGAPLYIRLHKKVHTGDERRAQREADQFVPVATYSGSVTTIHLDSHADEVSGSIEVIMPADVALSVQSQHGDVTVTGLKGSVSTDTHHGDLRFTDLGGNLNVKEDHGDLNIQSVAGDVNLNGTFGDITATSLNGKLAMSGDFPGDINLRTILGATHFHSSRSDLDVARIADQLTIDSGDMHGSNLAGPFTLRTKDFNVDLNNVSGDINISNSNGDVDVVAANPLGNVQIDNRSSSIRLTLPQDAGFTLDASTDGDISNDFGMPQTTNGSHKTVHGTQGNGQLRVTLTSNEDDISIRRAGSAATVMPTGALPPPTAGEGLTDRMPQPPPPPPSLHRLTRKPPVPAAPSAPKAPKAPAVPVPETVNQ